MMQFDLILCVADNYS